MNSPLDLVSESFNRDLEEARAADVSLVRPELLLVPISVNIDVERNDPEIRYKFTIFVSDVKFEIECRPIRTKKCFRTNTTTCVELRRHESNGNFKNYDALEYGSKCDETACNYLKYYAPQMKKLVLKLPPGVEKFFTNRKIECDDITLIVPDGTTDEKLIGTWLKTIHCVALPKLTINSPRCRIAISSKEIEQLKNVENLTINGEADINLEFLQKFDGSVFTYNNIDGDLPIGWETLVDFWVGRAQRECRKFVFNTEQPFDNLVEIKKRLGDKRRSQRNEQHDYSYLDSEFNRRFEISATHLMIDWRL